MHRGLASVIALSLALGSDGVSLDRLSAQDQKTARGGSRTPSKRMADGKVWTTVNLNIITASSHCYDDAEVNCRRYGRMYSGNRRGPVSAAWVGGAYQPMTNGRAWPEIWRLGTIGGGGKAASGPSDGNMSMGARVYWMLDIDSDSAVK